MPAYISWPRRQALAPRSPMHAKLHSMMIELDNCITWLLRYLCRMYIYALMSSWTTSFVKRYYMCHVRRSYCSIMYIC